MGGFCADVYREVIGGWRNRHLQLKEVYMKVVKPNQTFAAAVW